MGCTRRKRHGPLFWCMRWIASAQPRATMVDVDVRDAIGQLDIAALHLLAQ